RWINAASAASSRWVTKLSRSWPSVTSPGSAAGASWRRYVTTAFIGLLAMCLALHTGDSSIDHSASKRGFAFLFSDRGTDETGDGLGHDTWGDSRRPTGPMARRGSQARTGRLLAEQLQLPDSGSLCSWSRTAAANLSNEGSS